MIYCQKCIDIELMYNEIEDFEYVQDIHAHSEKK